MATLISYQDFLASQEAQTYPVDRTQLFALRTLFSNTLVSVAEIAQQVAAPIIQALNDNPMVPPDSYLLWRTIAAAVKELPQYNEKLVELVVELQKVPSPSDYISDMSDFREHWTEFVFHCKLKSLSSLPNTHL